MSPVFYVSTSERLVRFCFKLNDICIQNVKDIFITCGDFNLPSIVALIIKIAIMLTTITLQIMLVIHTQTYLLTLFRFAVFHNSILFCYLASNTQDSILSNKFCIDKLDTSVSIRRLMS